MVDDENNTRELANLYHDRPVRNHDTCYKASKESAQIVATNFLHCEIILCKVLVTILKAHSPHFGSDFYAP